jgi:hypothetical protein
MMQAVVGRGRRGPIEKDTADRLGAFRHSARIDGVLVLRSARHWAPLFPESPLRVERRWPLVTLAPRFLAPCRPDEALP